MTKKSQEHPENGHAYAAATLIASCIMFIRVVAVSGFYSPAILSTIIIPAGIMFFILSGSAYYFYVQSKKEKATTTGEKDIYRSPFSLVPALEFAGIIVLIKFIAGIGLIYKEYINPSFFYPTLGALS